VTPQYLHGWLSLKLDIFRVTYGVGSSYTLLEVNVNGFPSNTLFYFTFGLADI
jgi:hypothetical protein